MPKTGQVKHTKESLAHELKHGEQVTREDYNKYKESFVAGKESYDLTKPLSFKDYRDIAMFRGKKVTENADLSICLLYTSPSPRDRQKSRMPSSA